MKTSIKSLSESVKQLRFVLDEIKGFALILFDSNYKHHAALGEALGVADYYDTAWRVAPTVMLTIMVGATLAVARANNIQMYLT